jgi:hypothetical protein
MENSPKSAGQPAERRSITWRPTRSSVNQSPRGGRKVEPWRGNLSAAVVAKHCMFGHLSVPIHSTTRRKAGLAKSGHLNPQVRQQPVKAGAIDLSPPSAASAAAAPAFFERVNR